MSRCGAGLVEIGFDRKNPAAIAWAREHGAALVADVTDETRAAIRTAIARSLDEGIPPRDAARLIRDVVGLNERQVEAVMNYRADLAMAGDDAGAIARKAERYAGELRRQRALTIARTETMRASNEGQLQLWQQAVSRGLLTGAARRRWIATDDEKTCPICGGLDGKEAALDANFSPRIKAPPAHPNCRCTTALVHVKEAA
jgi:SPP1 gp7 family putative phage head morphogenesis protein